MDVADRGSGTEQDIRFPEPPESLRGGRFSLVTALKFFGPGAIIASISIGSGETVFASRMGAEFGYVVIWTVFAAALMKGILVYASNRYITVSGEHPMARFATMFPGPRGWFPILIGVMAVAAFPGVVGGLAIGLGTYLQQLGLGNAQVWAVGVMVVTLILTFLGGYSLLERAMIGIIALMVLFVIVAVFVSTPDWGAILAGLIPSIPEYVPFINQKYPEVTERAVWVEVVTFIGGLGGGMYDYIGYTGFMREKKWGILGHREIDAIEGRIASLGPSERIPLSELPEDVANARRWSRAPFGDMLVAFVALSVFGLAFMINGASILGAQRQFPAEDNILTFQSEFLTTVSPILQYFYVIAIFFAFAGTVYAAWEVYSWTAYECLAAISERVRRVGERRVRPWACAYILVASLILVLSGLELVAIITPVNIIGSVLAGGIYCFGLLYAERVALPSQYRLSGLARALLAVSAVALTIFGIIAIADFLGLIPS